MRTNRILDIAITVSCVVVLPVQLITTLFLSILAHLTFGLVFIPLSLIWLVCLLGPLLGLSWLWEKSPVLRIPLALVGTPLAFVGNIYVCLIPSMGELDSRVSKLLLMQSWPYTLDCWRLITNKSLPEGPGLEEFGSILEAFFRTPSYFQYLKSLGVAEVINTELAAAEAEEAEELAKEAREATELAAARAELAAKECEIIDLIDSVRPKGDRHLAAGSSAFSKGKAHYLAEQHQEALTWLDRAIECGLSCPDVYNLRGECLETCGRHDDAINDFNKAISLEPEDCNLYFQRATSKSATGDFDGALQDLQEAIRLSEIDNELNRHYRASAQEMGYDSHTIVYAMSIPTVQVEKRMAELLSTPSPSPAPS